MNGVKWGRVSSEHRPEKIVIVASGPSLNNFNFNILKRDDLYIITVNDAGKYVPFADAWFTLDPWGLHGPQLPPDDFSGKLFAAVPEDFGLPNARISEHRTVCPRPITYLHRIVFHSRTPLTNDEYRNWGLNEDPSCINTLNSGFGAFNLAYHMRPKKILLLGLDASHGYFYDTHKNTRSLSFLPLIFESTIPQIERAGISVVNGSVNSRITCFERMSIENALDFLKD